MKKCLLILLVLFSVSCGKRETSPYFQANGKVKVLSTIAMIDDIVAAIGGEEIDHLSLIVGDLDPHSYELVKGDDEKLLGADVIFYNGLGLEHGASLRSHLLAHPEAIALGDLVYKKDPKRFVYVDHALDPHFWMDVALFSEVVDPIVSILSEKDPSHAPLFLQRGEELKEKMVSTDRLLKQLMSEIPQEKRFLVTSHDAFFYFTKKYLAQEGDLDWKLRFMAPEGLAPDGQMSLLDIQKVSDFLCEHQIQIVFPETNINQDALKRIVSICRQRGLEVKICSSPLYGDTMGTQGTGAESYLDMIEHNAKILHKELQ